MAAALASGGTFAADDVSSGLFYGALFPNLGRLTYDATTNTYSYTSNLNTAASNSFGASAVVTAMQTYNRYGSGNYINYAVPGSGTSGQFLALAKLGASNSIVQLTYVSYGLYGTSSNAPSNYFVFGVSTPFASIPTTGSATYNGALEGSYRDNANNATYAITGTSALNANFATLAITNTLSFTGVNLVNGGAALGPQTFSGSDGKILNGFYGNTFTGNLSNSTDSAFTGNYAGRFFGPNANEVGYTFTVSKPGSGATPSALATGVVVGRRP